MSRLILFLLIAAIMAGCHSGNRGPDVSDIRVNISVDRFDEAFFGMDTNQLRSSLETVNRQHAELLGPFLETIVGVSDTNSIKTFFRLHKPLFDSSQILYSDFEPVKNDLVRALQYVKYYYPSYKIPARIIPIVGPMNSIDDMAKMRNGDFTGVFLAPDFAGISLQFYLGKDFSFYQQEYFINNVVPLYRSRRFAPEYIVPDILKVIADDLFPYNSQTRPLIEQMIEQGKYWWLVKKFMPAASDTLITGYTGLQQEFCEENEGLIWSYIVRTEDLHSLDAVTIQTYMGEGPFTQGLNQEHSPGKIGPWIGWQILKNFEEKKPDLVIEEIMKTPPAQILELAKYKPK